MAVTPRAVAAMLTQEQLASADADALKDECFRRVVLGLPLIWITYAEVARVCVYIYIYTYTYMCCVCNSCDSVWIISGLKVGSC